MGQYICCLYPRIKALSDTGARRDLRIRLEHAAGIQTPRYRQLHTAFHLQLSTGSRLHKSLCLHSRRQSAKPQRLESVSHADSTRSIRSATRMPTEDSWPSADRLSQVRTDHAGAVKSLRAANS